LIHFIFDKKHEHHHEEIECDSHDFHLHENKSLFITSLLFLISISLHNIPEGLALGSSFLGDETHGILLSIVVFGLHNFVIGYTICNSLLKSKIRKSGAIVLTLTSAVISYASSIGGYFLGNIDIVFEAILLSLSAGAILYIILKELLPDIIKNYDDTVAISFVIGIIITVLIFILH
jgi:ZIP family zinc transporter